MLPAQDRHVVPAFSLLLLLTIGMQIMSYGQFTYDFKMYFNLAKHFLASDYSLAISGYWSPLFVGILIPVVACCADPFLVPCIVMGLSSLIFGAGAAAALRAFGSSTASAIGLWPTIVFAPLMAATYATPDLMSAGFFAWATARILAIRPEQTVRSLCLTGVILGVCYLAKMVLLGVGCVMLALLMSLKIIVGELRLASAARAVALILVGLAVVAGPWISILSAKYGEFTIATTQKKMWLVTALEPDEPWWHADTWANRFVVPEPGRLSPFEDESVFIKRTWSPLQDKSSAVHYVKRVVYSVYSAVEMLARFDVFGIGLIAAIYGFALAAPWRSTFRSQRWRWTMPVIAATVVPYVALGLIFRPVAINGRYLFTAFPFLVIASVDFTLDFIREDWPRWRRVTTLAALIGALLLGTLDIFLHTHSWSVNEPFSAYRKLERILRRLDHLGPIACVGPAGWSCPADDASFFLRLPFHGNAPVRTEEDVLSSQALLLVVARSQEMDLRMQHFRSLEDLDHLLFATPAEAAGYPFRVYRNRAVGQASGAGSPAPNEPP